MRALSSLFSPNFQYDNQIQGTLNYDNYCHYIGSLSFNYALRVTEIIENGDEFTVNYVFDIIDNTNKFHSTLPAVATVVICEGLVLSISTSYSGNEEITAYMKKHIPIFNDLPTNDQK